MTVLGIANAFSGGVFLAIAFLHVLPEVAHDYDDYMAPKDASKLSDGLKDGDNKDYFPLPFALAFAGYAFILLIDKVVFDTHSLVGEHHHGHVHDPVQENLIQKAKSSFVKLQKLASGDAKIQKNSELTPTDEAQLVEGVKQYLSRNDKFAVRMSAALRRNARDKTSKTFVHNAGGLDEGDEQASLFADKNNIDLREPMRNVDLEANHHDHSHHDHDHHKSRLCTCNLTPVVLMIALSTHSTFEGIAVGLSKTTSEFWTLALAIALHKWCEAMSLGISISKNFKDKSMTVYILLIIFSCATPLGTSIGMMVSGSSDLTNIVFLSLTVGTFTYIACSEVIVEEFSTPDNKWFKMLFFLIEASIILGLNFVEGS